MKILIFAHSGSSGGAENALRKLVNTLRVDHNVHLILPETDSHEGWYYKELGIKYFKLAIPIALPAVVLAIQAFLRIDWRGITDVLKEEKYDLIISNTVAILHGGHIANLLKVPHVYYVHEYLHDPELLPDGMSREKYLEIIESGSAGLIGCSAMVISQFSDKIALPCFRFSPFDFRQEPLSRGRHSSSEKVLQVIGTQSERKNVPFAILVVKALGVLGVAVRLDIIGSKNNASNKIARALKRHPVAHRIIPHQENPCAINCGTEVITLVCSKSEPYGMTIPESLRIGVPVVSSSSGGPSEILPSKYLFPVDDVDSCVKILLGIWHDYHSACNDAAQLYHELTKAELNAQCANSLIGFLDEIRQTPRHVTPLLAAYMRVIENTCEEPISSVQFIKNIALVSEEVGLEYSVERVCAAVELEKVCPGAAVRADIKRFGAVPFGMSDSMGVLYQRGLGLAIELATTFNQAARIQMAAFIASTLWDEFSQRNEPLRILALGDGAGIDSLRLAQAGFKVHYMDYDDAYMTKIAEKNFLSSSHPVASSGRPVVIKNIDQPYDAIVCLEVIEHVADVDEFIKFIAANTLPEGLVFISECFNGVEDRWPTHLYKNERYSGMLPFLMEGDFTLESINRAPYLKPYVFRRNCDGGKTSSVRLFQNREVLVGLIRNQLEIGV